LKASKNILRHLKNYLHKENWKDNSLTPCPSPI
jgi:hypothetical protein